MTDQHRRKVFITAGVMLACLSLGLTGCQNDNQPDPIPEATETTSPVASETTEPTPSWEGKYNEKEVQAYKDALARWEEYETRSEPIWAKGKATPAAQELFKEYWSTWAPVFLRLQTYEENGLAVSGTADVLTSKASLIDLTGQKRVIIKQCVDPSPITVSENGKDDPPGKQSPYIRTITLDQVATTGLFMIGGVKDITTMKKVKPCGS